MKKLNVPDKENLIELYITQGYSMAKIATMFNTTAMTVRAWLNNYSIVTKLSTVNVYHELREVDFTDKQKELIIGSILGDGSLRIPKHGRNAQFTEKHAANQLQYLEWKKNLLVPFAPRQLHKEVGGDHVISGIKCVVQDSYKLQSISHAYITDLWKIFYRGNGKKIIPENIESYLTPFTIAVWICDDGSLDYVKRYKTYRMDLHTESFTYDENVRLSVCLAKFFSGKISIYNRTYKSGIKNYLSLSGKDALHTFCTQLKEYIPVCMHYKFNTDLI